MAVIPSRLAGVPEAFAHWMSRRQQNAGEQRAVERHEAWRQNLAATRAQAAREAQMQRGSMQRFQGDIENQMRILGGEIGKTMLPHQVKNPNFVEGVAPGNPHRDVDLEEMINQDRAMTGQDRYNAEQLYSRAHGTNMPSSSALARMLGAGDTPDEWVETPYNALSSQGGLGYDQNQRKAYAGQGQKTIADAMTRATGGDYGGLGGTMAEGSDVISQQYQKNLLQDVWAVSTKLAHNSSLVDANTAFHQIMQAMASGKISPMQIQQTANIDEGFFTDKQELAIQQPSREDRLARLAKEFGYLDDEAAQQGVNPIIR
jgi:hypothetical protein